MQTLDIFGRDNCSFCDKAKAFADDHRVPYRYHDVRDAQARTDLMGRLSVPPKTVPVIMVGKVEVAGGYEGMVKAWADGSLQQILQGE